jgi:hypothetical protein
MTGAALPRDTLDQIDRLTDRIAGLAELLEDAAPGQAERINPVGTSAATGLIAEAAAEVARLLRTLEPTTAIK